MLYALLIAGDEALAAGRNPQAEAPLDLQPRLDRALAALKLLHAARPRRALAHYASHRLSL